jgi:hypothetical protein
MFIRQSLDPDSMPSRKKRRMFQRQQRETIPDDPHPDRKVLYDYDTLEGKIFNTIEEQEAALKSGKWIVHPRMSLEEWLIKREEVVEKKTPKEHINWANRLKFRDSNKPVVPSTKKRYLAHMNVPEIIKEGHKVGLYFGTPETCPTKTTMLRKIKLAKRKII